MANRAASSFGYEHERLYLAEAPLLLHDMGALMLDTGLRVGETLTLEWPHVHLMPAPGAALGYLKVLARHSKNSKTRNVPLTERAVCVLKTRAPAKMGHIFHSGDGQLVYQTWLNQQHRAPNAAKIAFGVRPAFLPAHLRYQTGRNGRGRVYDHATDGTFERNCFTEVRASLARDYGARCATAPNDEPGASVALKGSGGPAKITTVTRDDIGNNEINILLSMMPGWRNRQTQRT